MDENRRGYSLKAPGAPTGGAPRHLPGRGSFPRVDDRLVEAEVTRDEMIGGHRIVASPANPPHATRQTDLDYVLRAHVSPGYIAATDLLTRHDQDSDFASDTCIYRAGVDPSTGARYLEEIAFEVVSEQNQRWVSEKAKRMHRRGVRRIFTVWIKTQKVCEWSAETESWRPLEPAQRITDSCLVAPLDVTALLDATLADNAVAEALMVKGNPSIRRRETAAEAKGKAAGATDAILKVLESRGFAVSPAQRQEILDCHDPDRLDRWLARVALISSAGELTSTP
ncbi:MAG TPA: hypothetical protein VIE43_18850 [Thermoanaerobaculia bacterium]|jgi:hypothetical protein|nr:hypothetical protein [Thermoanaerobaculia bacterium]